MPASWRTAPMPAPVAALPRTTQGMPIPYTVSRGEDPERIVHRPGTGPVAVCDCSPDRGRPFFGSQCPQRQRRCVRQRRCPVCGQRVDSDSYLAFGGLPLPGTPWFMEAGAHPQCLAYSLAVCPALQRGAGPDFPVALALAVDTCEERLIHGPNATAILAVPHGDPRGRQATLHFFLSRPLQPLVLERDTFLAHPLARP
ncbi:hypothetical protein [Nocardiopsis sp. LOL_012]|uniref:hypothetical protein n=1 Tax=Nocardiopsis sp. LOL_012 TaxID=3345409 RepID=UPI003A89E9DD